MIAARTLHPGQARAPIMVLHEPLSFWGGVSAQGTVIDRHHPQLGESLTGRIIAMTAGRGSSSSSSVLAELIRVGQAPAGIVLAETDAIIVLGAIVAAELYGTFLPVISVDHGRWPELVAGGGSVATVHAPADKAASLSWDGAERRDER